MSQIEVDKIIPQSGTSTQLGESGDTITIPAGATITNNGTANGFGSADTEKVKVSANDTTAGFLNGKLVAGTNISLTEGTDGGNETLTAALSGTIATAQIADDAVTLAKMAPGTDGNIISYDASGNPVAVATGSAGQVLTSAGAGAPPTFAAAGGITMADNWRLTTDFTGNAHPISSNLERNDTAPSLSYFGSQMTESSGVFTFPSTGIYYVTFNASFKLNGDNRVFSAIIEATTNNSSYVTHSEASSFIKQTSSTMTYAHIYTDALFDITDTSNQKVQFRINGDVNTAIETMANTGRDLTAMRFIRLGDT